MRLDEGPGQGETSGCFAVTAESGQAYPVAYTLAPCAKGRRALPVVHPRNLFDQPSQHERRASWCLWSILEPAAAPACIRPAVVVRPPCPDPDVPADVLRGQAPDP